MKNNAVRAAILTIPIAITTLSLTACGSDNTDCANAASSVTPTLGTAVYIPASSSHHSIHSHESRKAPVVGSHTSHSECTTQS